MGSKILFKNKTTYTQEIALEAGEAFWKVQPAYRKKAKRFKILAGILAVTFMIIGGVLIAEKGFGFMPMAAFVMAIIAAYGFLKAESLIRGSAKNFQGMNTKVDYGVSENYFFVMNREYVSPTEKDDRQVEELAEEQYTDSEQEESEETHQEMQAQDETAMEIVADEDDEEENEYENEYEDEFLSLEELLVCIVTQNLYILIWEKPYYILDRAGFDEGKDEEFRKFIEEKTRIIVA